MEEKQKEFTVKVCERRKNQLTWMPLGDLRKKIKNSIQKETKKPGYYNNINTVLYFERSIAVASV